MMIANYRHPILFYMLSTIIPWGLWFFAAYLSNITPTTNALNIAVGMLGILGLCAPMVIAFLMIAVNPSLVKDVKNRLLDFKNTKLIYWFLACFLMLGSILLAQSISVLFGYSDAQFSFSGKTSFSGGIFPGWFWLFFAPLTEELAWHSYGTDCLRQRMSLIWTSLLFALYWAFWHFPAFFIKGYYHSNLEATGWIYSLNFMVSIIPFVILMNWLYYKANRNILIAVVFHITAGVFNELFNTHPDSKLIQTAILLVLSIAIVLYDQKFFFRKEYGGN